MTIFSSIIYCTLLFLALNLIYTLVISARKVSHGGTIISLINAASFLFLSCLSLWQEAIYVDENNLSGNPVHFYAIIINATIFLILCILHIRLYAKQHKSLDTDISQTK